MFATFKFNIDFAVKSVSNEKWKPCKLHLGFFFWILELVEFAGKKPKWR